MSRELFVYWKLPQEQLASAVRAAAAMQRELAHSGLDCRLHRRADIRNGLATLMETYASAGGVSAEHEVLIAAAAMRHLSAWADAQRHTEVFESLND